MRSGDWKLLVDGTHVMVFSLRQDIGERNDLTRVRQDVAQRLAPLLSEWERDVNAEALINDPAAAASSTSRPSARDMLAQCA